MSIQIAKAIVDRIGIARFVHVGAQDGGALVRELRLQGCSAVNEKDAASAQAEAIVLDVAGINPIAPLLRALSAYKDAGTLVLRAPAASRFEAEQVLFQAGWRRHPGAMLASEYELSQDERLPPVAFYQRVPAAAAARWPVDDLQARALPMDALRESGSLADAAVTRYALAAEFVRGGDRVLHVCSGPGYGLAVMAALSRGAAFLGLDPEPANLAYADANYGGPAVSFIVGDTQTLEGIEDASVDLFVASDILEYADDWEAVLDAVQRVLKPDGRIVCVVPDRWIGAGGRLLDPAHRCAFDAATLLQGLSSRHFLVETKHIQCAPGGKTLPTAPRLLKRRPPQDTHQAEWLVVSAMMNPFTATEAQTAAYRHPNYGGSAGSIPPVFMDYGRYYDNPFLVRSLVHVGERLSAEDMLFNLALTTANHTRADSPDRGGAITVLGYMVLENRNLDDAGNVVALIEDYAAAGESDNPHTHRWRVSHSFLAGRLMEMCNDQAAALAWYCRCADLGWRGFTPLLATKTVAAWFYQGRLHLLNDDEDAARHCFESGAHDALDAARFPSDDLLGDPAAPLPFGLRELAELIDMGSQCATALAELPLWRRSPGVFMRNIDTRRFGLHTWAKDLERENRRLTGAPV